MALYSYGADSIDQDELRQKIYSLLMHGTLDNKRMNIKSIAKAAGVCHQTIMKFLDGKKMRDLTLCRLAEFVRVYEEGE